MKVTFPNCNFVYFFQFFNFYIINMNVIPSSFRICFLINANTNTLCECGSKLNIQHALSCKKGGFVSMRHNKVPNITAAPLKEVCHGVCVESNIHKLSGESFERTVNITDEARVDIKARGFWTTG